MLKRIFGEIRAFWGSISYYIYETCRKRANSILYLLVLGALLIGSTLTYIYLEILIINHEAIRNLALSLAALIGFPLLTWRTIIANRQSEAARDQADIAHSSHQAAIYSQAIDHLGAITSEKRPSLELRLGGIYALEKLAQSNREYYSQVMEVLCAYIRLNSPIEDLGPEPGNFATEDVKAVISVIGRLNSSLLHYEASEHNLSYVNLRGVKAVDGHFGRFDFSNSDLRHAEFTHSRCNKCNFTNAKLDNADFSGAQLREAHFWGTSVEFADFSGANMQGAINSITRFTEEQLKDVFHPPSLESQ